MGTGSDERRSVCTKWERDRTKNEFIKKSSLLNHLPLATAFASLCTVAGSGLSLASLLHSISGSPVNVTMRFGCSGVSCRNFTAAMLLERFFFLCGGKLAGVAALVTASQMTN
jgi:hypothetical protein